VFAPVHLRMPIHTQNTHVQVLGHTKTVLVLLVGWAYLNDVITPRKAAGMALAVLGMVGYGIATSRVGRYTAVGV
jgi:drug/metabolite transporter (DMT)-like permease